MPTDDDVAAAITQLHTMERVFNAKKLTRQALERTRIRVQKRFEVVAIFRAAAREAADRRATQLLRKGAASLVAEDVRERILERSPSTRAVAEAAAARDEL
jgi:ATP-dependent DNA ligase